MDTVQRLLRDRTFRYLLAIGLVSEIVYVLFFVAPFYLPRYYDTPLLDLGKITQHQYDAAWRLFEAFSALFVLYYAAYRLCLLGRLNPAASGRGRITSSRAGEESIPVARLQGGTDRAIVALVMAFSLIFSISLILMYPIEAADIFDYVFHGRILVHYHQNPFVSLIADFPGDPLSQYPAWTHTPSAYGPMWTILSVLPSALGGDSLMLNILFYKGLVICLFLLGVWLTHRIVKRLAPEYALPGTLLFAWNPLVLFETAGNGHNDSAMVFFAMLGIYLLVAGRQTFSILALVVSGLVKFLTGSLVPLFVIAIAKGIPNLRDRLAFVASSVTLSLVLAATLFAPFWNGPEIFGIERREEMFTSSLPTILMLFLSPSLGEHEAQQLVARGSALLFAAVLIWFLIRVKPEYPKIIELSFDLLYVYLLFFCLWFQPWYVIWIVPLAALIPRVDVANRAVVFSITATLSYFVMGFLWAWHVNDWDMLAIHGRAVAVIYPLPILFGVYSILRNRIAVLRVLQEGVPRVTGCVEIAFTKLVKPILRKARSWVGEKTLRALKKPSASDAAALSIILLLSLTLFKDGILHGQLFVEPDTVTYYYPVMSLFDRALERSAIPLWTPYIFGGYPLFADGEGGMLYPFNLLFSWLMPAQDAFIWLTVLRFFLAGAFTYAFVRSLGVKYVGALIAGIVFAFGSFMVGQLQHTNVGNSAIWLPLILCLVELALQARGFRRHVLLLFGGVAFGIQNLGVHVQPVLMTGLAVSLYAAFRTLLTGVDGKAEEVDVPFSPIKSAARRRAQHLAARLGLLLWVLFVVAAVGLGLAAVQLFPLYELGTFSFRGAGVSWWFSTLYSLPPYNLATLIFPYFFIRPDGSTWSLWAQTESTIYVGIAPLVLALIAVCFSRKRPVVFFTVLALASLLLAFGDYLPIKFYAVIQTLPGFSVLRVPARFSYLFVLSSAVLAAVGLEWVAGALRKVPGNANPDGKPASRRARRSLLIFSGVVAACTYVLVLALLYADYWLSANKPAALRALEEGYVQLRKYNFSVNAESVYESLNYSIGMDNVKTVQSIVLLVAVVLAIFLWWRFRSLSSVWQWAIVSLVAIDLMLFAYDFHPQTSIEALSAPSRTARFLADQAGLYRVYNKTLGMRTEPNRLLPFKIASVGGYSSLEPTRHEKYMEAVAGRSKRLLDLWNVKYIIARPDQTVSDAYKVVYRNSDTVVYENDSYLPRAFLVETAVISPPGRSPLNRLQDVDFNPATTVVLEEPFDVAKLQGSSSQERSGAKLAGYSSKRAPGKVEVQDYRRELVKINTVAADDAFLVLTDTYYPGWRAYVDGTETHIYRADYLFRGVYLPAGSHVVEFVFEPRSFEIGRVVSIATLLVVIAVMGYGLLRNRIPIKRKLQVLASLSTLLR